MIICWQTETESTLIIAFYTSLVHFLSVVGLVLTEELFVQVMLFLVM